MKNLLITMSGGTTTVINATLVGVLKAVKKSGEIDRVYAGVPGLVGVMSQNLIDLTDLTDDELERLSKTPSSGFIGTTRIKRFSDQEILDLEVIFKSYSVGYFLNIGGNGTIKQSVDIAKRMSYEFKVASLPKTVDNDLGDDKFDKVYFTPGYPSCINYWIHKVNMLNQENLGASSHDTVLVAQTFGRKTGFIAAAARMADPKRELPLIILLAEDQRSSEEVLEKIQDTVAKHGRALVVITEGYEVGEIGEVKDFSGQVMYSSSNNTAFQLLINLCIGNGIQARGFYPGVDQRSDILYTLKFDTDHAVGIGEFAVQELLSGKERFLASIGRNENGGLEYRSIPYDDIIDFTREMPEGWIKKGGFDVSDEYIEYASALIEDDTPAIESISQYKKYLLTTTTMAQKTKND